MNDYKVFQFPELDSDSQLKETIHNVNKVLIWLLSVVLGFYLINSSLIQKTTLDNGFFRLLLLFIVQILCLTVFKEYRYKTLATINMVAFYVCFFIYPFLNISRRFEENIYMPLVLLIFGLTLPSIFYNTKKDKPIIIIWVLLTLVTTIVNLIYQYYIADETQLLFFVIFQEHPMSIFGLLAAAIFLMILFYNYRRYNTEQHEMILELNSSLNEKLLKVFEMNNEKEMQNEELRSIQEELLTIKEELERKVEMRSEELRLKQRKIIHYGFMNSHILRAPIARIKGLISIMENIEKQSDKVEIFNLIKRSINDLDNSSKSVNSLVAEVDEIQLKEMEEKVKQLYGDI